MIQLSIKSNAVHGIQLPNGCMTKQESHLMSDYTSEIPYGYCQCGCGQKTELASTAHLERGYRKGYPLRYVRGHNSLTVSFWSRFWSKVAITADDNQCWLWQRSFNAQGYGQININDRPVVASRVAWSYPNYIIPEGMEVCHSCDTPACCNPKHLWIGTHKENVQDMDSKGRRVSSKGEDHIRAKLTVNDVKEIRERYAIGNISQRKLGAEYGVGHNQIGYIVRNVNWKDVE